MMHGLQLPVAQPHHRLCLSGRGQVVGRPGQPAVQLMRARRDLHLSDRELLLAAAAELVYPRKLLGELVPYDNQLVVDGVVLHAFKYLVVPVQSADVPVVRLPPEPGAKLLVDPLGTSAPSEQLHNAD